MTWSSIDFYKIRYNFLNLFVFLWVHNSSVSFFFFFDTSFQFVWKVRNDEELYFYMKNKPSVLSNGRSEQLNVTKLRHSIARRCVLYGINFNNYNLVIYNLGSQGGFKLFSINQILLYMYWVNYFDFASSLVLSLN